VSAAKTFVMRWMKAFEKGMKSFSFHRKGRQLRVSTGGKSE